LANKPLQLLEHIHGLPLLGLLLYLLLLLVVAAVVAVVALHFQPLAALAVAEGH
jgi:hypothetical protein